MCIYKANDLLTAYFDSKDLHYIVESPDETERLHVFYPVPNGPTIDIQFISRDDDNSVALRVFSLFNKVRKDREAEVLRVINRLNHEYRYVKFCLDSDYDLLVEYDIPNETGDETLGAVGTEIFMRLGKILGDSYSDIACAMYRRVKKNEDDEQSEYPTFLRRCLEAARINDDEDEENDEENDDTDGIDA